jgi:hypothetical protein
MLTFSNCTTGQLGERSYAWTTFTRR